ncbi:hypothetical protein ACQEV9_45845 [Streptomyces chartreusis]|uniref:hypothetical protein n=1 Tax=Streptomyces chartreusis TaxID=1969 RepID=UPI003D8C69C8
MIGDDKWMIGVRYHSEDGRLVRHYYVVDGAKTETQACRQAVERAGRKRAGLDSQWIQIQRLIHGDLGRVELTSPLALADTTLQSAFVIT